MRSPDRWLGVAALGGLFGCAHNTAPSGFLPAPVTSQQESYGGWVEVEVRDTGDTRHGVEGELIAVDAKRLWVLGASGVAVVEIATVSAGRVTGYRADPGELAGYTLLGTLTTIANGVLLVATAPLWVITGTGAAVIHSKDPVRTLAPGGWTALAPWSRFPQGLPPGLDLGRLRPKPIRS